MKNSLAKSANERRKFNTIAQKGTGGRSKVIPLPGLVLGEGTQLSNQLQLKKWARKIQIRQPVILALIDVAKGKGETRRVRSYWNTYKCFTRLKSSGDRLYGRYCKNRFCSICSGIRKADFLRRYKPELSKWPDIVMLTLTVKSPSASGLKKKINEMYEVLNRIMEKYRARNKRGGGFRLKGVRALECNFNPKSQTYNPHWHLLLPSSAMATILLNEWVIEGRKKWGASAISKDAQNISEKKGVEKGLIEVVKYSTKGFGKTKNSNESKMMVYAAAYDNIVEALKGHRVFDRFGFNLPKSNDKQGKKQVLKDFMSWGFAESSSDWIDEVSGLPLSNYVPAEKDLEMIRNNIDKTLE